MFPELDDIPRLRRALGLTQKELAKLAGVSQSTIAKIENGNLMPSYEIARKIFTVLLTTPKNEPAAEEVMSKYVISVKPSDRIDKAMELMHEYDISQLPVIDDHRNIGSITDRGVLAASQEIDWHELLKMPVRAIMEDPFPTVGLKTPVSAFSALLKIFPAVLVTDGSDIVGIITKANIFTAIINVR